jgi:hypothetical protein
MARTKLFSAHFHFWMPLAALTVLCWLTAAPARADGLTVSFSGLTDVTAGSTGNSFDVLLTNSSSSDVSIDAFFFEVLTSSPDVSFTDATTNTATPYIFGADSLFGPDIIGPGSTATDLNASDIDSIDSITLAAGKSLALGDVLFDVSSTAPTQSVTFTLAGFPGTSLADDLGNNVPLQTFDSGQFEINGAVASVPEPSTLILLLVALPFVALCRRVAVRVRQAF